MMRGAVLLSMAILAPTASAGCERRAPTRRVAPDLFALAAVEQQQPAAAPASVFAPGAGEPSPAEPSSPASAGRRVIMVPGSSEARAFLLDLPADTTSPRPLLLAFHGWGGSPDQLERTTLIAATALARGFVVARPFGIGKSFNAGTCCGEASERAVDDVAFARAIVCGGPLSLTQVRIRRPGTATYGDLSRMEEDSREPSDPCLGSRDARPGDWLSWPPGEELAGGERRACARVLSVEQLAALGCTDGPIGESESSDPLRECSPNRKWRRLVSQLRFRGRRRGRAADRPWQMFAANGLHRGAESRRHLQAYTGHEGALSGVGRRDRRQLLRQGRYDYSRSRRLDRISGQIYTQIIIDARYAIRREKGLPFFESIGEIRVAATGSIFAPFLVTQ